MDKLPQKLKPLLGWSFALLLGASLTGCSLLPAEEEALKPPLVKPAQENYRTVTVEKGTITQEIKGSGSLESTKTEIAQFTGQGGRIAKMLVASGAKVKKGDVLVQLNVDGLDIQLKEQQLSVARAKLALKQAKSGADDDAIQIAKLQMEIEDLKLARLMETFNSKQLVAGMDGQVTFVEDLEEGDFVEAYQTLVIISDPSKLRVALRVESGSEISGVDVGYPAFVSFGSQEVQGKVVQTPSSAPSTLNEQLKERYSKTLFIEVAKLPSDAAIGAFTDVKIILQQRDDILKIPRSGVRSFLGRTFVRTLEDGNKIREIDVETGIKGSTEMEITKGLEEGAIVVLQ
ncbi:macrolide-specific efflux system membrane fusion protein [Paenibacillus endophyticus]|uniref:Macrolide-specific efflux system membrane fusion protein n=1 Tax=Paenibacillus endophyticus TaxID=1294268 RepID=A0A7W5C4Z4_9BACL|nr:biotin/lipoyl-binding protein [Paenibacillus endophyticus]MBB3150982.1 macrolide-specific efflux system membrane fusion protein [Paenibacillus endophyticus]